jgi:acetyltransferase-like isoleucine patch superfamily enzyme
MTWVMQEIRYQVRYGLPVWFVQLLFNWLPDMGPVIHLRGFMVSIFLPGRPRRFTIGRDVTLLSIHRLRVGNRVYIAKGSWLNAIGGIEIEDEVSIAPYSVISSSNHGFKDGSVARGGAHPLPVKIGFGSWLAAHSAVAAGVIIGRGNILAANSVATQNTPDNVIVGGVPAKIIGPRVDNPSALNSKHGA